jgi:hypothetical protein
LNGGMGPRMLNNLKKMPQMLIFFEENGTQIRRIKHRALPEPARGLAPLTPLAY